MGHLRPGNSSGNRSRRPATLARHAGNSTGDSSTSVASHPHTRCARDRGQPRGQLAGNRPQRPAAHMLAAQGTTKGTAQGTARTTDLAG